MKKCKCKQCNQVEDPRNKALIRAKDLWKWTKENKEPWLPMPSGIYVNEQGEDYYFDANELR